MIEMLVKVEGQLDLTAGSDSDFDLILGEPIDPLFSWLSDCKATTNKVSATIFGFEKA